MPQGLQQPGVSQQQLLKAHTLRQDIFFLKAKQAEKYRKKPACGGCSGWDREGKERGAECVPLTIPGTAGKKARKENHFKLGTPLITADLSSPSIKCYHPHSRLDFTASRSLLAGAKSQLTKSEKTPMTSPDTHQTVGSDVPCPFSSFPSSPLVWLN